MKKILFLLLLCATCGFAQSNKVIKAASKKYDRVGGFGDRGRALVIRDGKFGFIDTNGNEIIPLAYDNCGLYHGTINNIRKGMIFSWHSYDKAVSVCQNGKWGMIDQEGNVVIPLKYDTIKGYMSDRKSVVWAVKDGKHGALDREGNIVIPFIYDDLNPYLASNRLSYAKKDGKYGYIDTENNIVIPFIYSTAKSFWENDSLAPVSINGKYGYIDRSGKEVIPLQYEFAERFSHPETHPLIEDNYIHLAAVVKNNKVGFINDSGRVVVPFEYDAVYDLEGNSRSLGSVWGAFGNLIFIQKNGKWGVLDLKGDEIVPCVYDMWSGFNIWGTVDMLKKGRTYYFDRFGKRYLSEKQRRRLYEKAFEEYSDDNNAQ